MKRCKINPNRGIISKMRCHNLNDDPKAGGVLTGDGQRNGLCHGQTLTATAWTQD